MLLRSVIFLLINFSALGLGGFFTGKGVRSTWYSELIKAPWTPPGWVFGAAWTTIMICFSVYLAMLWPRVVNKQLLLGLFIVQFILNVSWNPIFFYLQGITTGFIVISALTILMGFILCFYYPEMKIWSFLILPYVIWLLIATSLNGYILFKN